jgi:hypothetical protein
MRQADKGAVDGFQDLSIQTALMTTSAVTSGRC